MMYPGSPLLTVRFLVAADVAKPTLGKPFPSISPPLTLAEAQPCLQQRRSQADPGFTFNQRVRS